LFVGGDLVLQAEGLSIPDRVSQRNQSAVGIDDEGLRVLLERILGALVAFYLNGDMNEDTTTATAATVVSRLTGRLAHRNRLGQGSDRGKGSGGKE